MTFTTEITGMTFFRGGVGKSGVHRLALAEIRIPELGMHINGVQLTWTPNKGYAAQSPSAMIHGAVYAIQWNIKGDFARDLAAKMTDMYQRMGGRLPSDEAAEEITNAGDAGKPKTVEAARNRANGARRIAERPERIERRVVPFDLVSIDGNQVGEDDAEGLHRVLGVDPVSETMEQAGL